MKKLLFALTLTFLYPNEYVLVTNQTSKIEVLSLHEIQALYLAKKRGKIVVLNQCSNCIARGSFEKHILKQNRSRLNTYWIKQHYLGIRPPKVIKSEQGVKLFLKNFENSIGYIDKSNIDNSLKIIYEWSE